MRTNVTAVAANVADRYVPSRTARKECHHVCEVITRDEVSHRFACWEDQRDKYKSNTQAFTKILTRNGISLIIMCV